MKLLKHLMVATTDFLRWAFDMAKPQLKKLKPVHFLLAIVLVLQWNVFARASSPEVGDYVVFQQVQGTRAGAVAKEVDPAETQEKIARFTSNLVASGFDWKPKLQVTEDGISYPKTFHAASFYFDMSNETRQKWLLSRAVKYQKSKFPFEKFLGGSFISTVELSGVPNIKQISETTWESEVRAIRVVVGTEGDAKGAAFKEKLSFRFVVQEVSPIHLPEWGMTNDPLNPVLKKVQSDGLKIINFEEIV